MNKQQNNQINLNLRNAEAGAASGTSQGLYALSIAEESTESLSDCNSRLMEKVLAKENLRRALKRVKSNKGSAGVDGMTVNELPKFLKQHWLTIKEKLLTSSYKPKPVLRVEIPKADGAKRKLGIPTVLDRFIQQALLQVMQETYEPKFSDNSYGFRPKRSGQQAVRQAQSYISEGYNTVVDVDLEKFFDLVNHDKLMSKLSKDIKDKRILKLIGRYLRAGVLENGLFQASDKGTPQGGPLSPLLSNIVLDELDKELEKRGHRFVRYADDCNVYVKSERAGKRVMQSLENFITRRLKLKVNKDKSAVGKPWARQFLGFSFFSRKGIKIKLAPKSLRKVKNRIRQLTRRTGGRNIQTVIKNLNMYLKGWMGYFGICETRQALIQLDKWIRRRLRCLLWKQWGRRGYRELRKRGVSVKLAWNTSKSAKGWWRISHSPAMYIVCLLYTSPSPRDRQKSRMPSSA